MEVTISLTLTKKETDLLKSITFKADATDSDYYSSQVWIKENQEALADRLCERGIFRYCVSSWGYQEHDYFLTEFGKEFLNKYLGFQIPVK